MVPTLVMSKISVDINTVSLNIWPNTGVVSTNINTLCSVSVLLDIGDHVIVFLNNI